MRSPRDAHIIEIDITNQCPNRCSNCTRLCGHHKTPFFMDLATFKEAVDSLEDWEGVVGIIGGEPTIHPEFEKFAEYLLEKRVKTQLDILKRPTNAFQRYMDHHMRQDDAKVVLLSSLNYGYYKHMEVINEVFGRQLLNDHHNACLHQALLMPYHELGIDEDTFIKMRDNCWVQNTWSPSITPKGAFFCEVAAALDMTFNGPGGWKVEKGWYNRKPSEFGEQLKWCEICSLCLDVPQRLSNDGKDDVTPDMYKKLVEIESPKALKGAVVVHDPENYDKKKYHTFTGNNDYMDAGNNKRFDKEKSSINPKSFLFISENTKELKPEARKKADWIIISENREMAEKASKKLKEYVLNPGCLYIYKGMFLFNPLARSVRDIWKTSANLGKEDLLSMYPQDKIVKINILDLSSYSWMWKINYKAVLKRRLISQRK
ncbi:MAG: radical SAM protein [Eubacterium sp.]|nr:radical SAM protein [Eubacterium sp.]